MPFIAFQNALNQNPFSNVLAGKYNNKFKLVSPAITNYIKSGMFVSSSPFEEIGYGTKLFACQYCSANIAANIYEYNMTTPYDISTAGSTAVVDLAFNTSSNPTGDSISGMTFDYSGKVMYVTKFSGSGNNIMKLNLTTPWTLAGKTAADFTAYAITPVYYAVDYAKVLRTGKEYIYCSNAAVIAQFDVTGGTTPVQVGTVNITGAIGGGGLPSGISIHPSGSHVYISNNFTGDNNVYRFRLTRPYDITSTVIVAANKINTNPNSGIVNNQTVDICIKRSTGKPLYVFNCNNPPQTPLYSNIYTYTSSTN
jgi:hypothetical protein